MKKYLSTTLAAILAVSALSVTAFADDPAPANATVGSDGTATTAVAGTTNVPTLDVTIPATLAYVANPYLLAVTDEEGNTSTDGIVAPEFSILNNGLGKLSFKASMKGTVSGGAKLLAADGKINAKGTDKEIKLWLDAANESGAYEFSKNTSVVAGTALATDWSTVKEMFTLAPAAPSTTAVEMPVEADLSVVTAAAVKTRITAVVTGNEDAEAFDDTVKYYLKEGKTQDDIAAALADEDTNNTNTKMGNAIAALLTSDEEAAAKEETFPNVPTEQKLKISGEINSNAAWTATDTVALEIKWKIDSVANTAE